MKFEQGPEQEPSFDLSFYVTDHSADTEATGSPEQLKALYEDIKRDGIESVRYDWRWNTIEPSRGTVAQDHIDRYRNAKQIMEEVGLEEPTVILSSPPAWAIELYKQDKEQFFAAYRQYIEHVRDALAQTPGSKISRLQVLNELNNEVYTPVAVEDLPQIFKITREVFQTYNPDIKLLVTVLASNTTRMVGIPIEEYLPKLKAAKDGFDVVAVDYYPGLWHLPTKDIHVLQTNETFKDMVKNTELLKEVYEELATWGKEYELGEVGLPTKSLWGGERGQRYFYDAFFRAYKHLLVELRSRGIPLPLRVGFYEAVDEPPKNLKGKILSSATPFPEHDMGLREASGKRKEALERLKKIISYLRSPME